MWNLRVMTGKVRVENWSLERVEKSQSVDGVTAEVFNEENIGTGLCYVEKKHYPGRVSMASVLHKKATAFHKNPSLCRWTLPKFTMPLRNATGNAELFGKNLQH